MNLNKFTEKAQEAVLTAQQLAEQMSHAQIEPEHLLLALVEQSEGIVPEILRKMDVDPKPFAAALREELSRLPQAYGGAQPSMSQRFRKVADDAQAEATRLKDEFVSTEPLLPATDAARETLSRAHRTRAPAILAPRLPRRPPAAPP